MTIEMSNYEDHRKITLQSSTLFEIKIDGNVVYTKTVSIGKKADITFQLQETDV